MHDQPRDQCTIAMKTAHGQVHDLFMRSDVISAG